MKIKLAIVSPCYNEEEVLADSAQRLMHLMEGMMADGLVDSTSHIVFVSDGSTDGTWPLICRLHADNAMVGGIRLSHNSGHQLALMAGMMDVRRWADAVVTIDADLQDDLACIPQMVRLLQEGHDVVYGVKASRRADPLAKRLTARLFYRLQSALGVESVQGHSDFRLLSRRALDMLAEYGEQNLYLRGLIPLLGLPAATVSDTIIERRAGRSKYSLPVMLRLASTGITSFSVSPMHAIVYVGLLFLVVALGIALYVAWALVTGAAVSGWASLMLSIWLVGGFIIFSIGLAGIYIGNIYAEVKHRPRYHIIERTDAAANPDR